MRKIGEVTHVISTDVSVRICPVPHKRIRVVIFAEKRIQIISVGSIDPVVPQQGKCYGMNIRTNKYHAGWNLWC